MSKNELASKCRLTARNIGGIDEAEIVFEPGVTVLAGRNATNRTSLLRAVMAALGSNDVSIKADADEASVELATEDAVYTRTLRRQNGTIRASGDPYLDDTTIAELFAFLLESNDARRAVVTDADLREIIMEPIDTANIQAEIDRRLEERQRLTEKLDELDGLKDRLPSLEEKRQQLRDQIEDKRAELEELEAEIDANDADVEQSREEQAELEEYLETLRERRSALEDVRYEIDTEEESLDSLRREKREVEAEYESLPETPAGDLDDLDDRIDRLRTRKQGLESELNELQSVIGFNEEMLGAGGDSVEALQESNGSEAVTEELLPDDTVSCWTCGSEVAPEQIESTVEKLREVSQETVGEISDVEAELDEVKTKRRERREAQRRRTQLDRRKQELTTEIEDTRARLETLEGRRTDLREEIERAEAKVETLDDDDGYDEILDLHKEANQLEYDLGTLETDLERVEDNIATIEERLDEEREFETRREEIDAEIEDLRTKIERIEQQAIDEFNDHMDTVLELLEYDNLARIWLERQETEVRDGRQTVTKPVFELHIVRQTDSGTAYEDTVDHLSESEREVTGLVFALAGYLAHEVYETVPFMLLDSLEAIDSSRIATLVTYFAEYSKYLIVALLPDDARALSGEYARINQISGDGD